jgi:hypothetical protein
MSLTANPLVILTVQGVAFWPVWRWYVARLTDGSDEPWGVFALGTALLFLVWNRKHARVSPLALPVSSVFIFVYTVAFPASPPLFRAVLAVLALSCTVSTAYLGQPVHLLKLYRMTVCDPLWRPFFAG